MTNDKWCWLEKSQQGENVGQVIEKIIPLDKKQG